MKGKWPQTGTYGIQYLKSKWVSEWKSKKKKGRKRGSDGVKYEKQKIKGGQFWNLA